jgi:hypothetical protein
MTAMKRATQKSARKQEVDDERRWELIDIEQEYLTLKTENKRLKKLVVQLSLGKLKAEEEI